MVEVGLPIVGAAVVFAAVLLVFNQKVQIPLVLLGLLMIEAGIWKLHHPLMPSSRKFKALRTEVDDFINLVRRMNTVAMQAREQPGQNENAELDGAIQALHRSVERMAAVAGRTDDEIAQDRLHAKPVIGGDRG